MQPRQKNISKKFFPKPLILFLIVQIAISVFLLPIKQVSATTNQDDANGIYTDDFTDTSGMLFNNNTEIVGGKLVLTNIGGVYNTSGYAVLDVIIPLSVVKWGTFTLGGASKPTGTSIKIQVLDMAGAMYDDAGGVYNDTLVPGNSTGLTADPSIDISSLSVTQTAYNGASKFGRIAFKLILTTTNTAVTPSIDDISFTWTVKQGNLSASTIASTAWAAPKTNNQAINRGPHNNSNVYPTIVWKKDIGINYGGPLVRGAGNIIYYKAQGGIISWPEVTDGYLMALNKNNGSTLWSRVLSGFSFTNYDFTLSENGTIYNSDIFHDMMMAFDATDGSLKWTYQFIDVGDGHGNTEAAIGTDGSVYTIRTDDVTYVKVYSFRPNGSVAWITRVAPNPNGTNFSAGPISVANNGTIYFTTSTYDSGFSSLNNGLLYALDPTDGSVKWTYATGDSSLAPVIDSDGTIYVANDQSTSNPKKITAVNPDGTLKWQYTLGTSTNWWDNLALRSDGILLAERGTSSFPERGGAVDAINTSDGTLAWSKSFNDDSGTIAGTFMADASNGFYRTSTFYPDSALFSYYDASGNNKWSISKTGGTVGDHIQIYFAMQDENGDLYIDTTQTASSDNIFAIHPWTLSVGHDLTDYYRPGNTITFTATSSMPETNPLSGGDNQVQVVVDNGDKVALTYSSTDGDGNSVWTGSYTIPSDISDGTYTYTVEASQPYIQTDITTHFVSAPTGSSNTGITSSGTFMVQRPGGGGGPAPSGISYDVPSQTQTPSPNPVNSNQQAVSSANPTLILDSGVIYLILNGSKQPFVSMAVFLGLGYNLNQVTLSDTSNIPEGTGIFDTTHRHPPGSLVLIDHTVYYLGDTQRFGFPSEAVFKSWNHTFNQVIPANPYDEQLPIGEVLQLKP